MRPRRKKNGGGRGEKRKRKKGAVAHLGVGGWMGPDQNPHGLPGYWGRVWLSVVTKVSVY